MEAVNLSRFLRHVGCPVQYLYDDTFASTGRQTNGAQSKFAVIEHADRRFRLMLSANPKSRNVFAVVWDPFGSYQLWLRHWNDASNQLVARKDVTDLRESLDEGSRGRVRCFRCGRFVTLDSEARERLFSHGISCDNCWPFVQHLANAERRSHRVR